MLDAFDADDELLPLLIAVAPSAADRIRLAERLEGIAPLLLVSDLDELRRLLATPRRAGLTIDAERGVARLGTAEVPLTPPELALLDRLRSAPARTWSYAELHRAVWPDAGRVRKENVQYLVKRLRRTLAPLGPAVAVDAVRGVGFRLAEASEAAVDRVEGRDHGGP